MSDNLSCDERGVIMACSECDTGNRITYSKMGQKGRCGSCGKDLPEISQPVDINSSVSFDNLIADSPLPVVVDFWAPWCGPCQMMGPEFSKASNLAAGEAIFVKVNTESQPGIASRFAVKGIPAFALLENGKVIRQLTGARMAAQLLEWIRQK